MNKKQISLIVVASILLLATAVINVWYLWIKVYGREKTVSFTTEIGPQSIVTTTGETETQPVFEISYWPNAMEIKLNTIFDENQDKYYYYGVQYALEPGGSILFNNTHKDTQTNSHWTNPFRNVKDFNRVWSFSPAMKVSKNAYMSDDNWATSVGATMDLDAETMLKIKAGENLFGLKMVGVQSQGTTTYNFWEKGLNNYHEYYHNYFNYNWDYLFYEFYSAVKGVQAGTSQYMTFKFGDIFKVYEHQGNAAYVEIDNDYNFDSLIKEDKVTYITIKLNVYDYNLNSSSDSSFGWYKNSQTYNVQSEQNGYFMGRDIINLDLNDFNIIANEDTNSASLSLSQNFIDYYSQFADKIYLDILIDQDKLTAAGYNFEGVSNAGLDNFTIKSFKIQYTENGETKVVNYEY